MSHESVNPPRPDLPSGVGQAGGIGHAGGGGVPGPGAGKVAAAGAGSAASPAPAGFALYLASLAAGALGALAAFYLLLAALLGTGHLPPPAFTNSLCIDEKFSFMREHPAQRPNLLVFGSSVAWRHFDGAALVEQMPQARPLNGGLCGLHANQSVYTADWLLGHYPGVRQVVMIAAPQDFAACSTKPTEVFDQGDVSNYVFRGASPWPYYLRYFAPTSLYSNARHIKAKRAGTIELDPLVFGRFGGGPLDTNATRETLLYGKPDPLEQACFDAVGGFAQRMNAHGRTLTVVSTPLHPQWKASEDPDGRFHQEFNTRLAQALQGTGAQYWDADQLWPARESYFTDAIHLRWSAASLFTAALARQLKLESAPGDAVPDTR